VSVPPFTTPAMPMLQPLPGGFQFTFGPRWLGQACDDAKAAIANLQSAKNGLQQALGPTNQAYNDAVASGNADAINAANAARQDLLFKIGDVDSKIVAAKAALAACEAGNAPPAPEQQCTTDQNCGPGFICVSGQCIPGCRDDSTCGPGFRCVKVDPADAIGSCEPIPAKKAGMGGGWALVLLALAAVGAIFVRGAPVSAEEI